ncbi:hypothetical protein Swol_2279 [Syntrophomonas wolfei subsp. wolfei str. Goettingen G311]|uniref:WYL domain-containing protein n=1 Tax=Syntrophomonas wolfei subsp. wolfei (strain DSM 2245B / Goettingen) TaxID=335541 RepID=Q0AUN4_SYNWW|nr:hypothetical protein Swol_2279 [Syntrophomonas wolfei subsp. wolfei str. Goettingen G311]
MALFWVLTWANLFKKNPTLPAIIRERVYVTGNTLMFPGDFRLSMESLLRAIIESYQIKAAYINNRNKTKEHLLDPLGLVYKRNVWYLVAALNTDAADKPVRVLRVE